jgi:hypothetical protein
MAGIIVAFPTVLGIGVGYVLGLFVGHFELFGFGGKVACTLAGLAGLECAYFAIRAYLNARHRRQTDPLDGLMQMAALGATIGAFCGLSFGVFSCWLTTQVVSLDTHIKPILQAWLK